MSIDKNGTARMCLREFSEHNRKRIAFLALKYEQTHLGKLKRPEKATQLARLDRLCEKIVKQEYLKRYAHLEAKAWEYLAEFDEKIQGDQARRNRKRFMRLLGDELDKYGTIANLSDEWRAKYGAFMIATAIENKRKYDELWKQHIQFYLGFGYSFDLLEKLIKNFGLKRKNAINPNWWEILKQEIEL